MELFCHYLRSLHGPERDFSLIFQLHYFHLLLPTIFIKSNADILFSKLSRGNKSSRISSHGLYIFSWKSVLSAINSSDSNGFLDLSWCILNCVLTFFRFPCSSLTFLTYSHIIFSIFAFANCNVISSFIFFHIT